MLKSLAPPAGYAVVRLLASTYRFRCAAGSPKAALAVPGCYVLAIWHQNLFAGILAQSHRPHCVMVSRSRDGDWVSYLCKKLGHHVLRGSSRRNGVDKGGREAKDEMVEALQMGLPGAVTVDGPKGPAHQVKPGIVDMARLSGLCIVPYLPLPRHYWSFPSWDAFRLPVPFTRIDVHYGEPIVVPPEIEGASFSAFQQQLAAALVALEDRARSRKLQPAIAAPIALTSGK
jgi:lysophospholipid acyltransferase (LPLAT)-like uncharacterized protein